jgi:serine/threonine protein kinase
MDFGAGRIAPEYRDADEVSDVAGTPRYMAPELFKGGSAATKATDIYSFGILLYFLVTARFPIEGTPLWKARKGLPSAFVDVVTRAIAHDPALRPVSATAMQEALDSVAERARGVQFLARWQGWLAIAIVVAGLAFLACPTWPTGSPTD